MTQINGQARVTSGAVAPTILVKAARQSDVPDIAELLASSFYARDGWKGLFYPLLRLSIAEDLKYRVRGAYRVGAWSSQRPHYACLTAVQSTSLSSPPEQDKTAASILGTVELSERQSSPWPTGGRSYAYISNLAVCLSYRRRGIAQRLLTVCAQTATSWGFDEIYLHVMAENVRARSLYQKLGYVLVSKEETPVSTLNLNPRKLTMRCRLPLAD